MPNSILSKPAPEGLVDALDEAQARQFEHWAVCPDQHEIYGCGTCERNAETVSDARRAVQADPFAVQIDRSDERRAFRREASRVFAHDHPLDDDDR